MVRLITVHGTFAGRDSDTGESWWQKGSPFMVELQNHVAEDLEIAPFHWSGANSEVDRRRTGTKLASAIHDCEDPPIVVGHSHGGSAAIQALLLLYLRRGQKCCDLVRGFVTVGTPMFRFRPNRNPFSRFDVAGRLMLLVALGLITVKIAEMATGTYAGERIRNFGGGINEFVLSVEFILAAVILVVLYAYSFRNTRRQKIFRDNTLAEHFSDRYVALNHDQDEAINGLIKAKTVSPKLIKMKTVFVALFSSMSFVFVGFFFLMHALDLQGLSPPTALADGFVALQEEVIDPAEDAIYAGAAAAEPGGVADRIFQSEALSGVLGLFALVPVGTLIILSAGIALLVSLVATPGLSAFLTAQLKSQSFGDDGFGETIDQVAPGLDFSQPTVGTLPKAVQQEMISASTNDAGEAIQRLRELLSSGELLDSKGADLVAQSMKFERSELLHNAYFHSPLFAKQLAAELIVRFGLTPTPSFESDVILRDLRHKLA
ncbi:hypothetical protein HK107_12940 [Parvularcula sp. ZS-1/3]|uniref:AB hydrolase-1 domain-containing protein n=1 Tax=Parvularcula mediterranea TaxID=2732508 RepID=A0A7Y3RPC7_9PROT|nr:alpha/beta fold hydrolase [Parvularcula mediterranea]NNU17231.1 hypothetical protein [Parvularcula mediterranea]